MILSEVKATVTGAAGVNFRRGPGIDRKIHELLLPKTEILVFPEVQDIANNFTWILAKHGNTYGFVVKSLVALDVFEPPPPPPKPNPLYVGVHVAFNGDLGNFMEIVEEMSRDDYPIPAVWVISDPGLCKRFKEIDPRILVGYRWVAGEADQPPMTGDEDSRPPHGGWWYKELFRRHSQAVPYADLHQLHNEITFVENHQSVDYAKRFNQFCMEMMEAATADGQHVTFGNFNPGVPEQRHIDAMRDSFAYAEAHGHWLCYHPYTDPKGDHSFFSMVTGDDGKQVLSTPFFGLRPLKWVEPFPRLNVIGAESAHFNAPRWRGEQDFVTLLTEMHNMVKPYNTPLRRWLITEWTIRGQNHPQWKYDDNTPAMPIFKRTSKYLAGL